MRAKKRGRGGDDLKGETRRAIDVAAVLKSLPILRRTETHWTALLLHKIVHLRELLSKILQLFLHLL